MATRRWLGRAIDIAQKDDITIALVWATGDTVSVTIANKTLTATVGSSATTADVATLLKEMINGDTLTDTTASVNETGNNVPEFNEVTASVSGSVVTVTGDTKGKPFTMTASESTAGTGTATLASNTTATGKHYFSDQDNWSGNTVPVDTDTIVFDEGNVDVKYDLSPAIQPAKVIITQGYEGRIGLAETNEDDTSNIYREYRTQYLTFDDNGGVCVFNIGQGDGAGSGQIKIDTGTGGNSEWNVYNTGSRHQSDVPSLLILGTETDNKLNIQRGDVGVAFYEGETAEIGTIRTAYIDDQAQDVNLVIGSGCTLSSSTLDLSGGVILIQSAASTITVNGATLTIRGSGAVTTINGLEGTIYYETTGTCTTANISAGCRLDFTRDLQSRTITTINVYEGATVLDPNGTGTFSTFNINKCDLQDVNLNLRSNTTLTFV